MLVSCEPIKVEDIDDTPSAVRLITRAADGTDFETPLYAYAFNKENGRLITCSQLSSEDFTLILPQQTDIRIVTLAANPDYYDIPSAPSITSLITMKMPQGSTQGRGYTTSPLQMGFIDINPLTENTTVSIQLHYQVASLSVQLQGLPSECTSAHISVASPANGLTFSGIAAEPATSRVPLAAILGQTEHERKTFATTAPVYLFPTTAPTTFTIAYNDTQGEQYASATYQAPLKSGVPYQLAGIYADGSMQLTGSLTPSQWSDPLFLDFTFSNGEDTTIPSDSTDPGTSSSDIFDVTDIPQPFSLWNGHIVIASVAGASASEPTATITLLSLGDWGDLTSSISTNGASMASSLAASYSEFDLSGWHIPTETEARMLSALYRDDPMTFCNLLDEADASPIVLVDGKGNNLRYLCDDGTRTYSFYNNLVTNAGVNVKNYHLRLVRTVQVRLVP